MIHGVLLAVALAADPPAADDEPERTDAGEHVSEEITVYGEHRVQQARREVVRALEGAGYTRAEDKGDYVLLRSDQPWKGEIRVYDDGWVMVKRAPVRVSAPGVGKAPDNSALAWAACAFNPLQCVRVGGIVVSKRKFRAQEARALAWAEPEVRRYAEAVADHETDKTINGLPERLELLWNDGVPLQGDGHLEDASARKTALLDYWDSRTDTAWGDRVRAAVEAFVRGEVQHGDHPFTDAEIRAFNDRRTSSRALDLTRDTSDAALPP